MAVWGRLPCHWVLFHFRIIAASPTCGQAALGYNLPVLRFNHANKYSLKTTAIHEVSFKINSSLIARMEYIEAKDHFTLQEISILIFVCLKRVGTKGDVKSLYIAVISGRTASHIYSWSNNLGITRRRTPKLIHGLHGLHELRCFTDLEQGRRFPSTNYPSVTLTSNYLLS